jgi:hypothetical protein
MATKACLIAAALVLSAGAASAQGGWQFQCPPAGTRVELSGGGSIAFRGTDRANPLVCLSDNDNRRFAGLFNAALPALADGGLAQLRGLFPASPGGRQVVVRYNRMDGRTNTNEAFTDTWRVVSVGPLRVPAGTFTALGFERATVGAFQDGYRHNIRFWLDVASGAPLKVEHDFLAGPPGPGMRNWEATAVRLPAPPRS